MARFLAENGVARVFELSGGMITHLLDSLHRQGRVQIVSMHHEQGAAFAVDAAGRLTGVPHVAMATSGPGATNLLTGIGSCYFDSSPSLFITGQVNRNEQKGDRPIRQLGFQETDIVSMVGPITKAAWRVEHAEELSALLPRAFDLARSGRPGPVLLDIPMDVQREAVTQGTADGPLPATPRVPADRATVEAALRTLRDSRRPLMVVGGGVRAARGEQLLRSFAAAVHVPVVSSLMAVDALPYDDPLRVGMIGSYGNRWVNLAIGRSDTILVIGSRLDIRQTGADTKSWKGERTVIHVDVEAGEINNRVVGCEPIVADAYCFLEAALSIAAGMTFAPHPEWEDEIRHLRAEWPDVDELKGATGMNPNVFMHELSRASGGAAAYVVDVGQHQMWAAQSLELRHGQRFLTSGGMGSMGFALPAAVGTALTLAGRPVVVIAGDGGFQSNIQELQTVVRNSLPLKIVILNNHCHGMVRQFQESYFESRFQSTVWGYSAPDFEKVASAYGLAARTIAEDSEVGGALGWLWSDPLRPALLQVMIDETTNVYPKIAFGRPMTDMEPYAKPIAMEGA